MKDRSIEKGKKIR